MDLPVEHEELEAALRRCGVTWNASQAHGFLCGRLALLGVAARTEWIDQLTAGTDIDDALRSDCGSVLESVFNATSQQLADRLSGFMPLLPGDEAPAGERAEALAHWSEGFLHGLVSGQHPESLRTRLATEPLSDIIKDLLEITRATAEDESDDDETNEQAYAELVEYIRVAAQLTYEELAGFRAQPAPQQDTDSVH